MPLSDYALDAFIGKDLSKLSECNCSRVKDEYPESDSWLSRFILTQIFVARLDESITKFAFSLLRKSVALFDEYEEACAKLSLFVSNEKKSVSLYFKCLYHFENSIALLYQSYELGRKLIGKDLFEKNDGSPLQRLNEIYNDSRHSDLSLLPEGKLQRIWIDNQEISTTRASIFFHELEDMIREIGDISKKLGEGELVEMLMGKKQL
jgi:hypothetical protein